MRTEIETPEDGKAKLTLYFPGPEATKTYRSVVKQAGKDIKIPGFKPNKVPFQIIEQRAGKEQLEMQAVQELVNSKLSEALGQRGIKLLSPPQLIDSNRTFEEGQELSAVLHLEPRPEVKLPDYDSYEIKVPRADSQAEEMDPDNVLPILAWEQAPWEALSEGEVQQDDQVTMDYEGYYEDGISIEAYSGQDEKVLVREDSFVPGAAEQLFGMKEGDSKTIEVSFPEDYGDPNVDGKNTTFKVAIKAIERKLNVPEIDDELAKQQGFESLEQLKEALENQKQSVREYAEFQRKQALVMQRVLAESEVDIPGWLLEREKGDQESGPSAEQRLKLNMIMAEISDREGVSVSQQEVGAMLQHRLQGTGLSPEDLSREQIQGVAEEVFVMKVTRALLQKVKVDLVEETEAELETVKKASEQLREVSAVV